MSVILKPAKVNRMVTEHFRFREFQCPCCQRIRLIPIFWIHVGLLEEMRKEIGAMVINSGYRCSAHNIAIGGSERSMHMEFATDIRPADGDTEKLERMWKLAYDLGFKGVGKYDTFIHLDLRPDQVSWTGKGGGS